MIIFDDVTTKILQNVFFLSKFIVSYKQITPERKKILKFCFQILKENSILFNINSGFWLIPSSFVDIRAKIIKIINFFQLAQIKWLPWQQPPLWNSFIIEKESPPSRNRVNKFQIIIIIISKIKEEENSAYSTFGLD